MTDGLWCEVLKRNYLSHIMAEPSKFGATLNWGYFRFLSISHYGEVLELLFSAELKTNCLHLNMVYNMYLSYNLNNSRSISINTHRFFKDKI